MKGSKLIEVMKDGNITIPIFLLKNYKNLKLKIEEFIFLMYLYNKGNKIILDPKQFGIDLDMNLEEIMALIDGLTNKGFISIDVSKNDKGFME